MVEFETLATGYAQSMEEIKFRMGVVREELLELQKRQGPSDYRTNVISAELCYLQFRRISELLALAILEAHRGTQEGQLKSLEKDYRADFLVNKILDTYPRGFPIPVRPNEAKARGKPIDFQEDTQIFNRAIFKEIHTTCSDRLHVGNLSMLKKRKFKKLDSAQLREWYEAYVKGLSSHLLPLSDENDMLYTVMHDAETGKVTCRFCRVVR